VHLNPAAPLETAQRGVDALPGTSHLMRELFLAQLKPDDAVVFFLACGDNRGMRVLPTGTITMLFSDIEGSTGLLGRLGDRYGEALSAQRALLRAAFAASRGHVMGTEGDSFFVVFESAGEAVRCCVAAQRALSGHAWPGGVAVRVRMGLHSGEPARHEDGYIGLDVHRAARIAAAAHGGQVILSEATRLLVQSRLPVSVSVRDLGFHRLKDIEAPEHIYQLAAAGMQQQFPPLKSLGAPASLPVPLTPLVGRDADLGQLRAALAGPGVRLVTLTGTGGVGKTRLALAAASSLGNAFQHGVFFVALAAVSNADVMWKTIADSLDIVGDKSAADAVTGHLRDRQALLVLDNLEQLDGAAGVVATLLAAAPRLVVLATSRRPLHLQGEHELPVPPLEIPRGARVEEVAACGAAQLFVQQAELVRPGFALTPANAADIAAITGRLDGLPLAIELAASRVKLLPPRALRARLGQSLGLAAADIGRPSRQQTLRDTIAWSYDLLTRDRAEVFRRMGVFAGGCDLDALAAVAMAGDGHEAHADPLQLAADLLDLSLITVTEGVGGDPRVRMLETIREYALERLSQSGHLDDARQRHAQYYAAFAERAHEQLSGPARLAALDHLEAEHDNLRAALSWSLETQAADPAGDDERAATGLRLVQALAPFWYQHGHATEGRRWLQQAIALAADEAGAPLASIAHWLGVLLQLLGELDMAIPFHQRGLAIWRDLGNRDGEARELNSLAIAHSHLGDLDTARSLLEDSAAISRQIGSDARLATALTNLGQLESAAGNFDRAIQALREALTLDQKQGDMTGMAIDQQSLAVVSLRAGRAREARDLLSRIFDYVVRSGDTEFLASSLELSACIAAHLGDRLRAARLAGAAETIRQEAGMPISRRDATLLEQFLAPARGAIAPEEWDTELGAGRALTQQQAITLLTSSTLRAQHPGAPPSRNTG
jgi:predicted ATPase/class 3 adenylate cyclase